MKSKKNTNVKGRKRLKLDALPIEIEPLTTIITTTATHSHSIAIQTDLDMTCLSTLFENLSLLQQNSINTSICIERFRNDDLNVKYYTGFKSYNIFEMVFELLEGQYDEYFIAYSTRPECDLPYGMLTEVHKLSKKNQFFLFMIRLRRGTDLQELGTFFNLSHSTVSRIIISWTRFVYSVFNSISLWQSKEKVQQNLPFEMKKNYPTVRVIVDCTEFEIEQPRNPQAQQNTWSNYKNTNTAKGLIGITPNGVVSYISPLYGGATTDRAILNMEGCGSLIELLEDGDQVMSDRGFSLDRKFSHLTLVHPPFLERHPQLLPENVLKTRIIAQHRIHVERFMGRIKNYKLLNGIIPIKSIHLLDYWFYICSFLTIFDEPLVKNI
ncbi:unnamed protein product [Rotaria socialis]|uniref:DDE Tnp4 domain-containing protein n=1 Tax=Rotaria socialis TaxID=392032 RepID=A0A818GZ31_9BILA|nr:unnamed protein product [Rotaria socialis]CAF3428194.1 unnamed protein product [Rotaria socialis]CAF3499789.1 unnamed protein product [Rotaria socialis]CAF4599784.1 unnamed protein product [Rotaria socialis]